MSNKNNAACTIDLRQIEKDRELVLNAPQKDIAKYEKVVSAYGNVTPVIVVERGNMYNLIDGHARLEACVRTGINEIPVVVAQTGEIVDQVKLSLMLSASREQGNALNEGALIERLVKEHGQSLGEISLLVGRSKAWLSKRQTMAHNLSAPLRDMVTSGTVCTRTAEEISKLPHDEQVLFAANITKESLNKDEVSRLVRLYRSPDATIALCRSIIESPSQALLSCPKIGRERRHGKKRAQGRLCGASYYAMNLLEEIGKMICSSDDAALLEAAVHLLKLQKKMLLLTRMITAQVGSDISPGKQGGGQVAD